MRMSITTRRSRATEPNACALAWPWNFRASRSVAGMTSWCPHTQSMFQIAFPASLFASFLPWLMLNREGLSVLVHPETGDDYRDHSAHAAWLGAVVPLRLGVFSAQRGQD
jgi:aromatic ring-cleaving dioxygenase